MKCKDCGCEIEHATFTIGMHDSWADCARAAIKRAERAESELATLQNAVRAVILDVDYSLLNPEEIQNALQSILPTIEGEQK